MSERKVVDCDDCSRLNLKESGHLGVTTKAFMDGSGHRDTWQEYVDLCTDCLRKHLMKFLTELSHENAAKWVTNLKNRK